MFCFILRASSTRIIKIPVLHSTYVLSYFIHYSFAGAFPIHYPKDFYLVGWGITLQCKGKGEREELTEERKGQKKLV